MFFTFALLVFGAFFCQLVGWLMHQAIHRSPWAWLRAAHWTHHEALYRGHKFLQPLPYQPTGDRWRFALLVELAAYTLVSDYLHDAFHVSGHALERFPLFWRLRRLHFMHHMDPRTNLGIAYFHVDRICGTYDEPIMSSPQRQQWERACLSK